MTAHIEREQFDRFYRGELSREERKSVVRHLYSRCVECAPKARAAWNETLGAKRGRRRPEEYQEVLSNVVETARTRYAQIASEKADVAARMDYLLAQPTERRTLLIGNNPNYLSFAIVDLLLERAFELGFSKPADAVELAELAVQISRGLDTEEHHGPSVHDLRALSWATVGNAKRNASDIPGAVEAIDRAKKTLELGTGCDPTRAKVLFFERIIRSVQGKNQEAMEICDELIAIYRRMGDVHAVGRTRVDRCNAMATQGDTDYRLQRRELQQALLELQEQRGARNVQVAKHCLANVCAMSGDTRKAELLVAELRTDYSTPERAIDLLRLRWVEGNIAKAKLLHSKAVEIFTEVRDEFVERSLGYDAALASLDLSEALFAQGKLAEMKERLVEAIPIFASLGIRREAIAALTFLKKAIDLETVTTTLIHETARFIGQVQRDPSLRFKAKIQNGNT